MQHRTDAQVHAFAIEPDQLRGRLHGQAVEGHIMGDGCSVIGIHMRQHALLLGTGKGIGQRHFIQPMNRAKAANIAPAHRLEPPEIKIMGLVVVLRIGEVAIITGGRRRYFNRLFQLPGFGQ